MAEYEDITIDKGSDVSVEVHLVEGDGSIKDLSGYSAAAKLKKTYTSDSDNTTDFYINIVDEYGIVTMSLTNEQPDALKNGRYVDDLEISKYDSDTETTVIERVLEGRAIVTPSVTR